jgi:hypothetical protein
MLAAPHFWLLHEVGILIQSDLEGDFMCMLGSFGDTYMGDANNAALRLTMRSSTKRIILEARPFASNVPQLF